MKSDVKELAKIRAAVKRHRKLGRQARKAAPALWADCGPKWMSKRWQRLGFPARDVDRWLSARCFSPWTAAELRAAGVTPAMAARRTKLGRGSKDTFAFKCSARQLSIAKALNGLGIPVLALRDAEEHLIDRNESLDDALSQSTVALEALNDAAASGVVSAVEAGDAVFTLLTAIRLLAGALSALGRETYRPIAQAMFRDIDRQRAAAEQALGLADGLGALSADLLAVHGQHYQALTGGTMATSEFGLGVRPRHSQQSDPV